MTFEEAKQQAIDRSDWVLCHGDGYYTARTPDGRDIIGKGENGVFVGGGFVFQVYGLDLLIDELYNDIYKKDS